MRRAIYWLLSAAVLAALGYLLHEKESILRDGRLVFLKQAPVDSRSRRPGNSMPLRYEIEAAVGDDAGWYDSTDGHLVLALDERHIGRFVRIHAGEPLAPDEILLRYRRRRGGLRIGAESFLFQKGHAMRYARSAYSELRVAPSGQCILVGLRDADLAPLGAARSP
ncbi:MAG: GDYXXLXY domain-containing protein [Planctomycetes bacterium]|nr:GDYXXLXY domain-containing protein [Planctomycetota bacterium]